MEASVLTHSGEQFVSDLIQEVRSCEDYFVSDLCEDWGIDYEIDTIFLPSEYEGYGTVARRKAPPLAVKTSFNYPTENKIRKADRDQYPYFHHELYGEVCVWKEALHRGSPHTELFAPIYAYDESNYEWAIVGQATDIRHRGATATNEVENRAKEVGWAPDDTETGTFQGRSVAIDYGYWWRQEDDWATGVHKRPIHHHGLSDIISESRDSPTESGSKTEESSPDSEQSRLRTWIRALFS